VVPCLSRGGFMHTVKSVALPRARTLVENLLAESDSGVSASPPKELDELFLGRFVAESYEQRSVATADVCHGPRGSTKMGRAMRSGEMVGRLVENVGCLTEHLQAAHAIF
jgi:hypothetical protein